MEDIYGFVARRRKEGADDQQISAELVSAGNGTDIINQVLGKASATPEATNTPTPVLKRKIGASEALLGIGILLVVVAIFVIIAFQWGNLSPVFRFLVVAIPNAILFLIAFLINDKERLGHIVRGTEATGLLILPATIGTFLYQANIYHHLDSLLLLYSTLGALPIYLIFDILLKKPKLSALVVVNLLAAAIFYGAYTELSTWYWSLIIIFALVSLIIAKYLSVKADTVRRVSYESFSTVLFLTGIPGIVMNIATKQLHLEDIEWILMVALVSGIVTLGVALLYGKIFSPKTRNGGVLQRFLLFGAACELVVPLLSNGSENYIVLLAIFLAIVVILLGLFSGVAVLYFTGGALFAISLIVFVSSHLQSIALPIYLLIIGFIVIGLSIFVGKIKIVKQAMFSREGADSMGFISDETMSALQESEGVPHRRFSVGTIILIIIVGLIVVLFLR